MSEFLKHTSDLVYLQFRDELYPMPMAENLEQLGEIIEQRVKPGLDELYDQANADLVEYAGFTLPVYTYPEHRLDFQYPEATEALKLAMVGQDLDIQSGPTNASRQDIWLNFSDNFDIRAIASKYPDLWREGVWPQFDDLGLGGFSAHGYVLGPVVRLHTDKFAPRDSYNQSLNQLFSTRWSVYISGKLLLDGLYEIQPFLREGFAVRTGLPAEYLSNRYGLVPRDNTYYEWYMDGKAHEERFPSSV